MGQAAREVYGATGDIRNKCELLLKHLNDIESRVDTFAQYEEKTEEAIASAVTQRGPTASHYMDSALASVDNLLRQIAWAIDYAPRDRTRKWW